MTTLRVYIATTDGPSEVQRLTPEDPDLQSVICLNGRAQPLPISAAYDAFVRKPTGVVERMVGHPVFRADVARPITDGTSWQLGLLLAHVLHHRGRLCGRETDPDALVWVTGEVDTDLNLHPVAGIAAKIAASAALFQQARADGKPVHLIVPTDNEAAVRAALGQDIAGLEVVAVARFDDVESHVGMRQPLPRRRFGWAMVFSLLLVLALAVPLVAGLAQALDWRAMQRDGQYIDLAEALAQRRATGGILDRVTLALFSWAVQPAPSLPTPVLHYALLKPSRFGGCPDEAGLAALKRAPIEPVDGQLDIGSLKICGLHVSLEDMENSKEILAGQVGHTMYNGATAMTLPLQSGKETSTISLTAIRVSDILADEASAWVREGTALEARALDILALSGGQVVHQELTIVREDVPSPKRYKFN
ncbi:hypothetical protein JCM17960_00280 [Magnetospira thiophila]